ncbi:recombinase family protein [Methylobacterium nodulans]|uniref:Resolvase domain-containing protein n=1 Tax=Methylobacterium nodulans (strain LMG 21967 / CNCM I-2342 / ORS 2060) TaxID=460265 RepID=B8IKY6_METNO|nr:recombinase family protein [Methylobacterium nodulans]ACL58174.1 resolvase domain-containing protein [Methylobacterium nodulans ORS 2060]
MRFCDLPQSEGPTGRFMLNQMAAVAELEAGLISARTRAALAAKKRFYAELTPEQRDELVSQGKAVSLGGNRGVPLTDEVRATGRAARTANANARVAQVGTAIAEIRASGITSATGIAKALTKRGIPTARGSTSWTTTLVQRVLARLDAAP